MRRMSNRIRPNNRQNKGQRNPAAVPMLLRTIDPNRPMVALTFDDGPSPKNTPRILDALNRNDAKATFFVLGTEAKSNPEILRRMINEGHEIGNHSYDHKDLTKLSDEDIAYQIYHTQQIISDATGQTPALVRPPYGFFNVNLLERAPFPFILWSVDTLDWKNRDSRIISDYILETVADGDVILLHDLYDSTAAAMEQVIPELIRRGYQLVTVSELAQYRDTELHPETIYARFVPA